MRTDTTTTTETIYIADLQEQTKTLKMLLEHQCKRFDGINKLTKELQAKLAKCKAFFDFNERAAKEEPKNVTEWVSGLDLEYKLYREAKEACK